LIADEKAIWQVVVYYAHATSLGKLAPHDLRRTCAKLCRKAGGELEQIQLLLGHASVQTTERNLDHDPTSRGEECSDRQRRSLGSIHELRHSFLRPHGAAVRRTLPPSRSRDERQLVGRVSASHSGDTASAAVRVVVCFIERNKTEVY
jgi:hypothetical protein